MLATAFVNQTHPIGPGEKAPRIVCTSWARDGAHGLVDRAGSAAVWREALRGIVVGHRFAYDAACALATGEISREVAAEIWRAYDEGRVRCTQASERLLDVATGDLGFEEDDEGASTKKLYNLASLTKRLGYRLDKSEDGPRTRYGELDGTPVDAWTEEERDYAMLDGVSCLDLFHDQRRRADAMRYANFDAEAGRQARYDLALYLTTCWGLTIDRAHVERLGAELGEAKERLSGELDAAGLLHGKKRALDTKAVRALIESSYVGGPWTDPRTKQVHPVPLTDGGKKGNRQTSTSREVLEACTHPALATLAERNTVVKIKSTYVDLLLESPGVVHPNYQVLVATGRTSSSRPNIQNQPRKHSIRECFVARPGWVLVSCDYDSQELRTLAQVLLAVVGKSTLARRYREDPTYDPHVDFCVSRMGIDYAEGLRRKAADDPALAAWRQRQKASNFGFPGGMGAAKFRAYARGYGLDLSLEEAEADRANWFAQLPEMREYFSVVGALVDRHGPIEQLYSGRLRGGCSFPAAANSFFQGLASDATKTALYEVARRCYSVPSSPLYGSRPAAMVHDEILLESPEDRAPEAAVELGAIMVEAMQIWTPDVPAKASAALMRRWSKKAKAVRDRDGRLVPWDDVRKEAA